MGCILQGFLQEILLEKDIKNFNGIDGIALMHRFSLIKCTLTQDLASQRQTMFITIEDSIKHNVDVVSISSGFTKTGLVGEIL